MTHQTCGLEQIFWISSTSSWARMPEHHESHPRVHLLLAQGQPQKAQHGMAQSLHWMPERAHVPLPHAHP